MNFILVGTNHKYSPIEVRERIFFPKKRLGGVFFLLKENRALKGAVILSTCNRVEIYGSTESTELGTEKIKEFICTYHEIDKEKFLPYLYAHEGKEAVRHLFSVACGFDSLITGEKQILGQVKDSFLEAETAGFVNGFLKNIFTSVVNFAAEIQRSAWMSAAEISAGSAAIDFIKEKIGSLSEKNILIIGVGKVTELVLSYLKKENPKVVFVANRTFEKAKALADKIDAKAVRFDKLEGSLKEADIIITAAASSHFILKKDMLENTVNRRLLIIDLGLPRNVEPRIKEIERVELFCLEDLNQTIQNNLGLRKIEIEKARGVMEQEVERIWQLIESEPERALLL